MAKQYEAEVVSAEYVAENRSGEGFAGARRNTFWDAFVDGQWRAVSGFGKQPTAASSAARIRGMKAETCRLGDGRYAVRFVPREEPT